MTDTPAAPAKDERPTAEAVERAMTYFAGKPKSFTGMPATLHGKTLAAHVAALTTQLEARDDETYEIGKRDGYESAVQDFDLATGGDGEFKGSTIPGETVDVPAMKARVLERLTRETARADAAVAEAKALREKMDRLKNAARYSIQGIRHIATPWAVVDTTQTPHQIVSTHFTHPEAVDALHKRQAATLTAEQASACRNGEAR